MPMIGARFYTQLDASQMRNDVIEEDLAKVEEPQRADSRRRVTAVGRRAWRGRMRSRQRGFSVHFAAPCPSVNALQPGLRLVKSLNFLFTAESEVVLFVPFVPLIGNISAKNTHKFTHTFFGGLLSKAIFSTLEKGARDPRLTLSWTTTRYLKSV